MVHTFVGVHEPGVRLCRPDLHCYSCNKDEEVPPGGAFVVCPECFHVYPHPEDLKKAYLINAWLFFKADMRPRRGRRAIVLTASGAAFDLVAWKPPRFHRLKSSWIMLRSVFRDVNDITFCQECIHDF